MGGNVLRRVVYSSVWQLDGDMGLKGNGFRTLEKVRLSAK